MVRSVVGSILRGVDPLNYFSFQPVLHDWCNKCCGMCYPVYRMVHMKDPLLLSERVANELAAVGCVLLSECLLTMFDII